MSKPVTVADNALTDADEMKEATRLREELVVKYSKRPLGLDVESGDNGIGLYVLASHNTEVKNLKPGMGLVKVNGASVYGLRAVEILELIQGSKLPIEIHFAPATRNRVALRRSRVTVTRGLSLTLLPTDEPLASGLLRVYVPNGTPITVSSDASKLNEVVELICRSSGLIPEKLVLIMQHREKENDVRHPSLKESAKSWQEKFGKDYRLRLISKKMAERYEEGVPIDGVSILTKNGFTDEDIQEIRMFMEKLLHLSTDATIAALDSTLKDEYKDLKLSIEEVKAIVQWHKHIVESEDNITLSPDQLCIRVFFEMNNLKEKVYYLKNSMTTAGALCEIISKDINISNPDKYSLHIKGLSDIRVFEQALRPEDIPNQVKAAVVKSGGYGRLQFVYKETREETDSEYDSSEYEEDIGYAPTAKAFRVGSIDGWSDKGLETLRIAMEEHMKEMELQEAEEQNSTADEEKSSLEDSRLELLKECVWNQYQMAEVIHNFDAKSIKEFPAHKKLHDLSVGDVMIVTGTDASGWSRGKSIKGGDEAYFPASYVEVVAQPEMLVEVIHDFDPKNVQYLPKTLLVIELNRGELLLVTGTHVSGWWRGCKVTGGPEGYFPGDYVRCITQPSLEMSFTKIYGEPVKEGIMKLRLGIFKRFQEKYVFLTKNELLYFNSEESDPQAPAGRIALRHPSMKSSIVRSKKKYFTLHVGGKSYECKVDPRDISEWIHTLEKLFTIN